MSTFDEQGGAEDMPPPEQGPRPVWMFQVGDVVSPDDRGNQGVVLEVEPVRVLVQLVDKHTGNVSELFFHPAGLKLIKRASEPRSLELLNFTQLQALPPLKWLVYSVLRQGELTALFGAPGTYKSFVALDIALRVALGDCWAGLACERGPVLYIAAEGLYSIRERADAWTRQFSEFDRSELGLDGWFYVLGDAISFIEPEFELLIAAIAERKFALIVIDTLARCMAGGDENVAKDMGQFVRSCDRLRKLTGATVLVVHHAGKGDARSERGSSAFRGAADAMLVTLVNKDEPGLVRVACEKQKEGAQFDDMQFAFKVVELGPDGQGGTRTSGRLTFEGTAPREKGASGDSDKRDPKEVIQETLAESFFEDGAPDTELKAATQLAKSTYHRHLKELVEEGLVDRHKLGRTARYTLSPKSTFYKAPPPEPDAGGVGSPSLSPTQSHGTHDDQQDPTTAQSQSQSPSPPLGGDGSGTETDDGPAAAKKPKRRNKNPQQGKGGGA